MIPESAPPTRRVLLVDDNERYRSMLTRYMRSLQFECLQANDGLEALEIMEAKGGDVALVLCDLKMPRMDGLALLGHLRKRWPGSAVMMITGVDEVAVAVKCIGMGALDYIVKPFQLEELRARVALVLERHAQIVAAAST